MSRRKQANPQHIGSEHDLPANLQNGAAKENHLNTTNNEETDEDVVIGGLHVCGKCRAEFPAYPDFLQHKQTCSKKPVVVVINNDSHVPTENSSSPVPPSSQFSHHQEITKTVYHNNEPTLNNLQQQGEDPAQYDDQEFDNATDELSQNETHANQDGDHTDQLPPPKDGPEEDDLKSSEPDRTRTQSVDSMEFEESQVQLRHRGDHSRSPSQRPSSFPHSSLMPGPHDQARYAVRHYHDMHMHGNQPEMSNIQDQLFHLQQQHIHQLQLIQNIQQQLSSLAMQIKHTPNVTSSANAPITTSAPQTPSAEPQQQLPRPQMMSQQSSSSGPSPHLMHHFDSLPRPMPQQMMPSMPVRPSILPPASFPMPPQRPPFDILQQQAVMPPVSSPLLQAPPRLPFPPGLMLHRKGKPPNVAVFDPKFPSDDPFFRHKCRFCHKVFGSDSALQIHIRSHTGERPFKCNICGNRFSTKGNLKVHFQRHIDRYPHVKMDTTPYPPSPPLPNERLPIQSPAIQQVPLPTIPSDMARLPSDVPTSFHSRMPVSQASGSDSASSSISGDHQPLEQRSHDDMSQPKAGSEFLRPKSESDLSRPGVPPIVSSPSILERGTPLSSSFPSFAHSMAQIMSESSSISTTAPSTPSSLAALAEQGIRPSETSKLQKLVENIEQKITDSSQCVICHRVLSCKSALQMHYRIHTGERPYKCRICLRSFTTKGNLKTHFTVHRAKPPLRMFHDCPICQKRFSNILVLQQHLRMHAAEGFHIPQDLSAFQIQAEDKLTEEMINEEAQNLDQDDFDDEDMRLNEMASHMEYSPEGYSETEGTGEDGHNGLPDEALPEQADEDVSEHNDETKTSGLSDRGRNTEREMENSEKMQMSWLGKDVEGLTREAPSVGVVSPPAYLTDDSSTAVSPSEPQPNYTKGIDSIASALHLQAAATNAENHHRQLMGRLPNSERMSPSEKSQEETPASERGPQQPRSPGDERTENHRSSQEEMRRHLDGLVSRHESLLRSHSSDMSRLSGEMRRHPDYVRNRLDEITRDGDAHSEGQKSKQNDDSHSHSEHRGDEHRMEEHRSEEHKSNGDQSRGENRNIYNEHKIHQDHLKYHHDELQRAPLKIDTSRMDNNGALDLTPKSGSSGSSENSLEALKNQVNNNLMMPFGFPHPMDGRMNGSSAGLLMQDTLNAAYSSKRVNGSSTTCHYCGKSFACTSALNIHYRSHTKERPYKCEICSKGFSTRGNLRQHMLTHKIRDMPTQIFDPAHPHFKHQQQQMMHPMHHLQPPTHPMLMPGMPQFSAEMALHQYQQQHHRRSVSPQSLSQREPSPSDPVQRHSPESRPQQLQQQLSPLGSPQKISPLNSHRPPSPFEHSQEVPLTSQMKSPNGNHQQSTTPSGQHHLSLPNSQPKPQPQHSPNNNNNYQQELQQKMMLSQPMKFSPDASPSSQPSLKRSLSESGCPSPPKRPALKHSCNVCSKQFQSDSALQIHIRTHTGEKPFKCHMCGRAFTTKGNLKVHLGTHMWNGGPTRRGRRISMESPLLMSPKEGEMFRHDMFGLRPMYEGAFFQYPPQLMNGYAAAMSKANEISVIQNHHSSLGHNRLPENPNSVIMKGNDSAHDTIRDSVPESVVSQN
ncbi:sal-like protein 3 [Asterias amurensis]|uniref:sal-like protein 3 n=1 Tax=Asterias amurensis TaxID=7602 RepID=UPI003AB543A1